MYYRSLNLNLSSQLKRSSSLL